MPNEYSPIFVGGTGRSGTTIIGKYLNSHRSLVTPVHENKLIVEDGGLRSLVENLSNGFDYKGNHYAILNFVKWANILRKSGFRNKTANSMFRGANKIMHLSTGRRIPASIICRTLPFLEFSLIDIGTKYGLSHYDRCVDQFLADVIGDTDANGIVDTEGLIRPIYSARTLERAKLLDHCRDFLKLLNEKKLHDARAERWCDDTPMNARYADFLLELYPTTKVVHMVRDPKDVAASYSEKSWSSNNLGLMLDRLKWQYRELKKVEMALPTQSFRTFKLEDFANEPEIAQRELCDFLELDLSGFDGSVAFEASSFGRWKKKFTADEAQEVERQLCEACGYFGYPS
jgi:hypothetical protein